MDLRISNGARRIKSVRVTFITRSKNFATKLVKFRNLNQKQEVVQVTFEQPAVSEHPQSCLPKDAKADAAILVQINGFQIGITNAASESAIFHTLSALQRLC